MFRFLSGIILENEKQSSLIFLTADKHYAKYKNESVGFIEQIKFLALTKDTFY